SLAGTRRAPEPTKINREDTKSFGHQSVSLVTPTLLAELAAMSQHNRTGALAVKVGADPPAILGRKGYALLCRNERDQRHRDDCGSQHAHAGIILCCSTWPINGVIGKCAWAPGQFPKTPLIVHGMEGYFRIPLIHELTASRIE